MMFAEFVYNTLGYALLQHHALQGWSHGVMVSFIFHLYKSFIVTVKGIGRHGLYIIPCINNIKARKGQPWDKFELDKTTEKFISDMPVW